MKLVKFHKLTFLNKEFDFFFCVRQLNIKIIIIEWSKPTEQLQVDELQMLSTF